MPVKRTLFLSAYLLSDDFHAKDAEVAIATTTIIISTTLMETIILFFQSLSKQQQKELPRTRMNE
eukprot:m.38363 g.38363  ORF g.38363 m.38363 type:complete len:65 (-) comp6793_c0_seq1:55-249(-)